MQTQHENVIESPYETAAPPLPPDSARRVAVPPSAAQRRDYFDDPRRKSPLLALLLSAMPGLGQAYVGYYHQGFINVATVASVIGIIGTSSLPRLEGPLGLFLAFFWLFNMVDAWRRAVFYNNALAGIGPATLPEEFAVTKGRGSLAGGVALIVIGVVLLSNTLFGVPLEWLERWWPVAFIGVGAWLAYPTILGKKNGSAPAA